MPAPEDEPPLPALPEDGRRPSSGSDRVLNDWLNFAPAADVAAMMRLWPRLVDDSWLDLFDWQLAVLRPGDVRVIFVAETLIVAVRHRYEYPSYFEVLYIGDPELPWVWADLD
jgi:hypothetical protein